MGIRDGEGSQGAGRAKAERHTSAENQSHVRHVGQCREQVKTSVVLAPSLLSSRPPFGLIRCSLDFVVNFEVLGRGRLRMLEEDRSELSLQAVSLQRNVDAERTQRLIAEEQQSKAQQQVHAMLGQRCLFVLIWPVLAPTICHRPDRNPSRVVLTFLGVLSFCNSMKGSTTIDNLRRRGWLTSRGWSPPSSHSSSKEDKGKQFRLRMLWRRCNSGPRTWSSWRARRKRPESRPRQTWSRRLASRSKCCSCKRCRDPAWF